jgi:simple sugar transport system ATP-binding protein
VFEDEEARLAPVSLSLAPGQALGLAGVEGSGREVFVRGLAGLGRLAAGAYALGGVPMRTRRVAPLRRAGIAYLPAARMETGLFPDMSVLDHLALAFGASPARARELFRRRCLDELAMTATPDTLARGLSGGNQQRLLLAMIPEDVRLLLIEHPTRGLDLESQDLVWQRLAALRDKGAALIFLTDDLDELLAQAGQAGVFHNRTLAACLPVAGLARSRVESLMVGVNGGGA